MISCLLVSPSSASARCHHEGSDERHRRPRTVAQSSGGAWRQRQAGTRHWTGFKVQGRTGTGTGSPQGDVLVARQCRRPRRAAARGTCACACRCRYDLSITGSAQCFGGGVRGRSWEMPRHGNASGRTPPGCPVLPPTAQLSHGVCSKCARQGGWEVALPAVTLQEDGWVPSVAAPRGRRCCPGPAPARCSGYWSCSAGRARGCANTPEELGPKAAVCSQCRQAL